MLNSQRDNNEIVDEFQNPGNKECKECITQDLYGVVSHSKLLYVEKKIQPILTQQRMNVADVEKIGWIWKMLQMW